MVRKGVEGKVRSEEWMCGAQFIKRRILDF